MSAPATASPHPLDAAFSAAWLSMQELPPVEYVVPGIIPEGLTLLVAPPKVGKSWMVLGIALAAAEGGHVFGAIPVDRRPVLYLALEDGPRRLQSRMRSLGVDHGSENLSFLPKLDTPAAAAIQAFLDRYAPEKPLIVLDTLGKVRGTYGGNDAYGNDYTQMSALKDLVDAVPGSSLVVVHHTNKGEKADFLDTVSGTQGLAGAADSILAIKRSRGTGDATLHVTSRDAAEGEYAVSMTDGIWQLDGDGLREAAERATQRRQTDGLGDRSREILDLVHEHPNGITPSTVAAATGLTNDDAGKYLRRLEQSQRVIRTGRGRYTPVRSVRTSEDDEEQPPLIGHSDASDTHQETTP
ncbi:AAA family ATPase [Brachybacterium tyrofermentans]|uniref:AAA family ATPase n=1 Tax=Brachybacterium tyrofermentans TaxID=47848 RepID=UPI003FCF4F4D